MGLAKLVVASLIALGAGVAAGQAPLQFAADHVSLSVANMATEVAWYEHVMGFKEVRHANFTPTVEFVELSIPGYRIDVIQNKASVRHRVLAPEMEQGWKHIAFLTPAIETNLSTLQALKTDVVPMKNKDGSFFKITLHDPEGNEIEIQPAGKPQNVAGNPLQLSPGHATLTVADLDKEQDWYVRVLGFTPAERTKIGDTAVVCHMSIPGYRIDAAWNKGSVRHAVLKRDLEQGWVHVVFKAADIDAVYARLMAEKADLAGVDRDQDGKITQLFVNDPEGNELEFVR
jgi:catechol 2,3-dioxygenase-like lactoylglutathione lyase family enzyme